MTLFISGIILYNNQNLQPVNKTSKNFNFALF